MFLEVPENGFNDEISGEFEIRDAQLNDVEEMVALEKRLSGIERAKDFEYFIENKREIWNTVVCRDTNGTLFGFLGSVDHPASQMIDREWQKVKRLLCLCSPASSTGFAGNVRFSCFPLPRRRRCKPLIPGVQETARSISPSAGEIANHPAGLSCQPSCLRQAEIFISFYTSPGYQTNRAFPCQKEPRSHRVQEIPRDPASPQSRYPKRCAWQAMPCGAQVFWNRRGS